MTDKKDAKKAPNLRFKGFTEDWEERKFDDILEEFSRKSKLENEFTTLSSTNSGMEVREGRVSGNTNIGYKIIENDDLVLSPQNLWLGNINLNNIGTGLVSPSYKTFKIKNSSSSFLNPQLRSKRLLNQYELASTQGASVVRRNLDMELFYQITLLVPVMQEQNKIGKFFKILDDSIILQQRKLDQLNQLKKALLQQMFPGKGETVPKLRFAGFEEDWEERKFDEFLEEFIRKSKIENEFTTLSSTNSGMEVREGRVSGDTNIGYKIIENDDLVLSPQNLWLGNINLNDIGTGLVSPSYKTFKMKKLSSSFLNPQLRSKRLLNQYKLASTQGASVVRRNLDMELFYQITLLVPVMQEQNKIGKLFKDLDDYIVLQSQKVNKLKSMKEVLLQNMFI